MGATIFKGLWTCYLSRRKKYWVNVYRSVDGSYMFGKPRNRRREADREAVEGFHDSRRTFGPRLYVVAVYRKPSDVFDRIAFDDAREMRRLYSNAAQAEAWPHPYPPRN